jgi:hypothetical protein
MDYLLGADDARRRELVEPATWLVGLGILHFPASGDPLKVFKPVKDSVSAARE